MSKPTKVEFFFIRAPTNSKEVFDKLRVDFNTGFTPDMFAVAQEIEPLGVTWTFEDFYYTTAQELGTENIRILLGHRLGFGRSDFPWADQTIMFYNADQGWVEAEIDYACPTIPQQEFEFRNMKRGYYVSEDIIDQRIVTPIRELMESHTRTYDTIWRQVFRSKQYGTLPMFDEIEADRTKQSGWFGADHPTRQNAYILATKRLFGQLLAHRRPQTFVQFMRIVLEFTDQLIAATYYIDNDIELPPAFNACNDCVAGYFFHGCPKCRQPPTMPLPRIEVPSNEVEDEDEDKDEDVFEEDDTDYVVYYCDYCGQMDCETDCDL
jgi:hypothetical protein